MILLDHENLCLTMILTLLPAGVPTARAAAPEWTAVGGPGFSAGWVFCTSLAIAGDGTLYVAYKDGSNKATVMKYSGDIAGWELVGNAGFSDGTTDYISLALAGGTPYVAYQDMFIGNKVTVMKYSGSVWEAVYTPGFSTGRANDVSLAIDGDGNPYVAYGDGSPGFKATVMKYSGDDTGWEAVGSPRFSAGYAAYISLAIGSGGTLYVAYQDDDDIYDQKATVMRYIPDTTAPVLTAGGVSRSSDSAATVSFNSNEEGQYYYEVVAEGTAAPVIDTSVPGPACGTGNQTIALISLSAGDWDIYIKVKDDSGNVSNLISMTIPALMAGIPNRQPPPAPPGLT
ncbi:MAG: hypothetical protein VB084_16960 [Syntrophomonadaceae bacterium]|nr:hypothetical protein [Syntrophomonadaceae bacterium]